MVDDFLGDWQAWREEREARLTAPHGFLSITALHWLDSTPQRYDGVPGRWRLGPGGVEVEVGAGESLSIAGEPVTGHRLLGPVGERGIRLAAGATEVEVASRGDAVLLRLRDPASPLLAAYRPTPTFPPSRDWVVAGAYRRFEGDSPSEDAVGEVAFTLGGEPLRLLAIDDEDGLWLVFADATSGRTTYPAGRQLSTAPPGPDGKVVLDFNRTANLPCAYTVLTTCPVPLPQNRLAIAIEAGEQDPSVTPAEE